MKNSRQNIEVEVRSFLDRKEWKRLKNFFEENGKFVGKRLDETVYFDASKDLRIRRDDKHSYLILKEGKVHDTKREEIEITLPRYEFFHLEKLLTSLGFSVKVRWYRSSLIYKWKSVKVFLWITKGYGWLIEFEKITTSQKADFAYEQLITLAESLKIQITPRQELERRFAYYVNNWKKLVGENPRMPSLPR